MTPSSRNVHLRRGGALFSVSHDAWRPFRVSFPGGVARALGTKFEVQNQGVYVAVRVHEGHVLVTGVQTLGRPVHLTAGTGVRVFRDGRIHPEEAGPPPVSVDDLYQVKAISLADVLSGINIRNRSPRFVGQGAACELQMWGTTHQSDPQAFLQRLRVLPHLSITEDHDQVIIRLRDDHAPNDTATQCR